MTNWLLRVVAALLATYAVSRGLRRVVPLADPRRSMVVHALSALVIGGYVYAWRQAGAAIVLPLVVQLGWLALDLARARAPMARAG